nr:MAG TPA: hypothetical protein [Caudoviricetes sp.]
MMWVTRFSRTRRKPDTCTSCTSIGCDYVT